MTASDRFALVVVRHAGGPPEAGAVAARLGVAIDALDGDFGIILLDPAGPLWCARVRYDALPDPHLHQDDIWVAEDAPIHPLS